MGKPNTNQPPQQPKNEGQENPAVVKANEDGSNLNPPFTGDTAQKPAQAPTAPVAVVTPASVGTVIAQDKAAAVDDLNLPEVVEAMRVAKPQVKGALHSLIEYCVEMAPKKSQTTASIEDSQIKLLTALYTLLSAEDTNFKVIYRAVLAIVAANRTGCFSIKLINRGLNGISVVKIDNRNMRFLTRVIDLMVLTVGVKNREQILQHFDLKRLLETSPNVKIGQNLTSYYSQ